MDFLYRSKLKSIAKDFFDNKILSSRLFNIICTMLYYQNINIFLNFVILTHLSIVVSIELVEYVDVLKQEQQMKKHLTNLYAHQKLLRETHLSTN